MIQERLIGYIEQSIRQNWEIEALSNYKEKGYSYKEIAEKILKLHLLFDGSGIKEGDKIALVGRNSANWCITYLATVTFGAVIVPILPDFKPDDLTNIINHSDSRLLFVDDKIYDILDLARMPEIFGVISLDDFRHVTVGKKEVEEVFSTLDQTYSAKFPVLEKEDIQFSGHAIECRINAENPETFVPSPGKVEGLHFPGGLGVRVDSALYSGYRIPPYYDSLIGKLIVFGKSRAECMMRLKRSLSEFVVEGVETTIPLFQRLLAEHDIIDGHYDIHWLEKFLARTKG